jgi:hypothetical protein
MFPDLRSLSPVMSLDVHGNRGRVSRGHCHFAGHEDAVILNLDRGVSGGTSGKQSRIRSARRLGFPQCHARLRVECDNCADWATRSRVQAEANREYSPAIGGNRGCTPALVASFPQKSPCFETIRTYHEGGGATGHGLGLQIAHDESAPVVHGNGSCFVPQAQGVDPILPERDPGRCVVSQSCVLRASEVATLPAATVTRPAASIDVACPKVADGSRFSQRKGTPLESACAY